MNGLLDFIKTPEGQGLLTAAFGGLAGARRGAPLNSIGRAGLAGLTGYSNAIEAQNQQAQQAQMDELRKMQVDQARMGMDKARADAAKMQAQDAWRSKLPSLMQPRLYGTDAASQQVADQNAEFGDFGAQMAATLRQPAGIGYGADQNALQAHLMDPNSPFADELVKRQLFPKQDEPFTLSEGQVRYGPGGKVIASAAPKAAEKTTLEKQMDAAGITDPAMRAKILRDSITKATTHAPAPSAVVNLKQETEEAKATGKFFGEAFADIQKSGFTAQSKINQYDRLGQLLEGVNTGKFTPTGLEVAKAASSLGLNIDPNMSNKEAANALSGEIALSLRNPSGGAGMPGAMSDADRQFLVNMVPGLATTPEGRALMIDTAKKMAKRDIDVARMARSYRQKYGTINEGFYDELAKFSEANPLFNRTPVVKSQQPNKATGGVKFLGFE